MVTDDRLPGAGINGCSMLFDGICRHGANDQLGEVVLTVIQVAETAGCSRLGKSPDFFEQGHQLPVYPMMAINRPGIP